MVSELTFEKRRKMFNLEESYLNRALYCPE